MSATEAKAPTKPVADLPLRAKNFGPFWWAGLVLAGALVGLLGLALLATLVMGLGVWGVNMPFVWGFDLINYAWWVGIANGSSLFAAILVLRRHGLRTAVNRFAEAVALIAVFIAGMYPIIHLGRPWLFWWVYPYPATYQVWPQFRSTLTWDFWAISTHVVVTALLWYVGLIPDLATLRDRARTKGIARIYGVLALGWRNSVRHWAAHETAYRFVAVLILPLILMMQSVVALEFATSLAPGWHENRLPIHFVATGLAQGMAAVLLVAILLRWGLGLRQHIDDRDIDLLCRLSLASALAAGLLYGIEVSTALLSDPLARAATLDRLTGSYALFYWTGVVLTVGVPQILWLERMRRNLFAGFVAAAAVNAGIWFDRFSLMIGGLERDYLSTARQAYVPTPVETAMFLGTFGLFALLLLLFARTVPVVSLFEARHGEEEH